MSAVSSPLRLASLKEAADAMHIPQAAEPQPARGKSRSRAKAKPAAVEEATAASNEQDLQGNAVDETTVKAKPTTSQATRGQSRRKRPEADSQPEESTQGKSGRAKRNRKA